MVNEAADVADRIHHRVRTRNRELLLEAALEIGMGVVFAALTFGFVFWISFLPAFFLAPSLGMKGWQVALIVTGIFALATSFSAWRRVDPLAELNPLTEAQMRMTLISLASPHVLYFSPRHATAGAALVLLAGPVGVFRGLGTWAHRLRSDAAMIRDAASLLGNVANDGLPAEDVPNPAAALLLRRLALLKVVGHEQSVVLLSTEKGRALLTP
ncbi:MAG: hypothetical protein GY715_10280 [Planctomycetes bacterium]|nr:hypothetical protein [Planctomycetota bacterium]